MATCTCGKCAACKKRKESSKKMPPWLNSKEDKAQDKKAMSGMTPAQKAKFKKEDAKHDKPGITKAEDKKKDAAARKKALAVKSKGKK
jgi:hypothetical protein